MQLWLLLAIAGLQLFALVGASVLLLAALANIYSGSFTNVPFVRTPRNAFRKIAEALHIAPGDTVYELGSGSGAFTLWCAHEYPDATFVGIELNPLLVRYARTRAKLLGIRNASFRRENIFATDLRKANKIYAYLLPKVMDDLLPKVSAEFRGTLASRAFVFAKKEAAATVEISKKPGSHGEHMLYLYFF